MPGTIPTGLGLDLVYLPRLATLYKTYGERFLNRVLTAQEKTYALSPKSEKMQLARIGGRIAVKEAVLKVLGIGISGLGSRGGVKWKEIELLRDDHEKPQLVLHGKALEQAASLGIGQWLLTTTHDGDYALAWVMGYPTNT